MAYFTRYSLKVRNVDSKQFNELNKTLKDMDLINYAFEPGWYVEEHKEARYGSYDNAMWVKQEDDMILIAKQYPDLYFELSGAGEDKEDFWREYYHGNKHEYCGGEIVYEQPKKIPWRELVTE